MKSLRAIAIAAVLAAACVATVQAQESIEVSLTATPSSTIAPANVTVEWSAPGATSCTASGAWSGTKAASGSEVVSSVRSPGAEFRLDCVGESLRGSARLTWVPPTQNTDDTPYTNPKGFTIHYGRSSDQLHETLGLFVPSATAYTVDDLGDGRWFFCVKAVTTADISSECSNLAAKDVTSEPAPTGGAVAQVTLENKPNPPTAVTAQ